MSSDLDPIDYTILSLKNIEDEVNSYLDEHMQQLYDEYVVVEIKELVKAMNMPKEFSNGVAFEKTAKNTGKIINTWGTDDTPLALWFNYGTRDHWIEPVNAKALAWKNKEGSHAQAIFYQSGTQEGSTIFSKGHYVSGVPRTEAMEMGMKAGKKRIIAEATSKIQNDINARSIF